ncbi:MAG: hypothetical protein EOO39_31445 [Cytophagaceae bacterium]|nr:MAG: hypothetical protein EOO39_31445 [Cytophagaceae bacterium]
MKLVSSFCLAVGLTLLTGISNAALVFTFENEGVQTSTVGNITTEDFEGSLNNIGTLTGGSILSADMYGGAGGVGKYLFAYNSDPATLVLNTDANYLGLWWSAGDAANNLAFYDASNNLLGEYSSTALSGLASGYYGNPTPNFLGQNSGEAYAYLNFTVTGGTAAIHRVVFGGSNFEIDNVSVTADKITPPGNSTDVPDASCTLLMMGSAILSLGAVRAGLKKKA